MADNLTVKMEPQMQDEKDGHLDKTVEEMVPHATHSCAFVWGEKKETTSVSCNKAATAKDLMTRSSELKKFAMRNKGKELVFVREGRAISSHWPCSLIKGEPLTIKYVKAGNKGKPNDGGSVRSLRQRSSDEIVIFQVLTRGGDGVKKILRNPALKKVVEEMTVYAYKGETVKQALRRDGRILKTLFSKNFGLFCPSRDFKIEMSMDVDDLEGQTYRIILLDKSTVPDSQPGSLDDTYISPNESQTHESDENQEASHQSTTSDSQNNSTLKQKQTINSKTAAEEIMCEIPKSTKIKSQLLSQFKESLKGKKTFPKLSRVQNLLRVEYGQNEQTCTEVRIMKKLMDLSSSVCLVTINGSPGGTGFLLFDNFVLTNGHVIKDIYNGNRRPIVAKVTVNFSYESLDREDRGQERIVDVTEVAGFEFFADESGHDWALLRLDEGKQLPDGLLKHCGFRPGNGGICIIGHPYGGIKKIDPCSIISSDNCKEFVEKNYLENQEHVQFVTRRFFEGVVQSVQQHSQKLNYKSCFYFGSSGSPVFDKHCTVVAMHSGGYTCDNARGEEQSVVEFGYHMSDILEHIIVQLVERGRLRVLTSYLTSDFPYHQDILSNVKKLVESRNLTAFKDTVRRSLSKLERCMPNDGDVLKRFFDFLSQREEPVPMDMSKV